MTAVGLVQHGSEAVGRWFEFLSCQIFLRFRIVTPPPSTPLIHKIFRYQEFGPPTNFFGTVRQKIFDENRDIPLLCIKFSIPEISETLKGSPAKVSVL